MTDDELRLNEINLRRAEGQNPYCTNPQLGSHYREDVNFLLDRLAMKEKLMSEERTWADAANAIPDVYDAREALDDVELVIRYGEMLKFGASAARRARERAEKRSAGPKVVQDTSGWACVNCQAKDAWLAAQATEIARLKEQLAEAKANAVDPGEIVIDGQVYKRIEA